MFVAVLLAFLSAVEVVANAMRFKFDRQLIRRHGFRVPFRARLRYRQRCYRGRQLLRLARRQRRQRTRAHTRTHTGGNMFVRLICAIATTVAVGVFAIRSAQRDFRLMWTGHYCRRVASYQVRSETRKIAVYANVRSVRLPGGLAHVVAVYAGLSDTGAGRAFRVRSAERTYDQLRDWRYDMSVRRQDCKRRKAVR